jgi:hypothetical protein
MTAAVTDASDVRALPRLVRGIVRTLANFGMASPP